MKIKVHDIPEEGVTYHPSFKHDPWFGELVKIFDDYRAGDPVSLELQLLKTYDHVLMSGRLAISLYPACARCLEGFTQDCVIPIRVHLSPALKIPGGNAKEEPDEMEDEGFFPYEHDEFDLVEVLREILYLEMPLRRLCREDCAGLCPRCGKNLNQGACGCKPSGTGSPWQALKNL